MLIYFSLLCPGLLGALKYSFSCAEAPNQRSAHSLSSSARTSVCALRTALALSQLSQPVFSGCPATCPSLLVVREGVLRSVSPLHSQRRPSGWHLGGMQQTPAARWPKKPDALSGFPSGPHLAVSLQPLCCLSSPVLLGCMLPPFPPSCRPYLLMTRRRSSRCRVPKRQDFRTPWAASGRCLEGRGQTPRRAAGAASQSRAGGIS